MFENLAWQDRPIHFINEPSITIKWDVITRHVEQLLRVCDKTQLPDSGLSILKRLEWQTYRDALRSIQDDFINPDDVVFPTELAEE